ncbi:hypothetical protein QOZ80_2AG0129160 [Eleusine coracana subsp. coracana]|nr:hypothetical protein QOZ80_2AG0129160 [Eleusine coracana subsp. coracana]
MGSPKAAKSMVKHAIWRRRLGAPLAAVLVILAVFVFSGQLAKGPNASSHLTIGRVDNTLQPVRDKPDSAGVEGSPNKEDLAIATPDQELDTGNTELKQASQAVGKGETAAPAQEGEVRTVGSEPLEKESPPQYPEGEEATVQSGSVPYMKCTPQNGTSICDLSNQRFDICELCGDARVIGQSSTVIYIPQHRASSSEEWSIRAQSRKTLPWIKKVTVKSLNASQPESRCTSRNAMPAIVFSLGGFTGNVWHDFSDVIVPLFLTARQFDRDVQIVITNNQPWFIKKYSAIFHHLTRHNIIDLDADDQNYTLMDFRLFVREAYGLPAPQVNIPYRTDKDDPDKKPRIMLIDRTKTRRLVNLPDVMRGLDWFGFEVVKADLRVDTNFDEFVHLVDSCDAIIGVHGAGLTNMVFLRSGAVLVHIVPYGIEFMADGLYGASARDMGLKHVKYSISPDESTLLEKYGLNHTVIKDPEAIRKSGWEKLGELYMSQQDIVLNMTRFGPSLLKAIEFIM